MEEYTFEDFYREILRTPILAFSLRDINNTFEKVKAYKMKDTKKPVYIYEMVSKKVLIVMPVSISDYNGIIKKDQLSGIPVLDPQEYDLIIKL